MKAHETHVSGSELKSAFELLSMPGTASLVEFLSQKEKEGDPVLELGITAYPFNKKFLMGCKNQGLTPLQMLARLSQQLDGLSYKQIREFDEICGEVAKAGSSKSGNTPVRSDADF